MAATTKLVNGKRVPLTIAEKTKIENEWNAPKVIEAYQIKAEAERRILGIMPVHKQRNNIARGLELTGLHGADPNQWPATEKAEYVSVMAQWKAIEAIRNKSNELEVMKPIPVDYKDDKYWP